MSEQASSPTPHYVTCRCRHCDGGIEFDANQLDPTQDVFVLCPHCERETKVHIPEQSRQQLFSDDIPHPSVHREIEERKDQPATAHRKTPPSRRNAKSQGSIGYFGLTGWWLNSLSESERAYIFSLHEPRQAKTLTEGTFTRIRNLGMADAHHSSGLGFHLGVNAVDFLIKLASWKLKSDKDYSLRKKVIEKIIELLNSPSADVVDKHIAYSWLGMHFYAQRKIDRFAIQRAVWSCFKQIEISPQIKPLMRTPTRLTTEELCRLSKEAEESSKGSWETGKSLWEYCLSQNVFRTNSVVRDSDLPSHDAGYRLLADIFKNAKQYDKLVALCENAIKLGWEGQFWKDTLIRNRVYLGDESPASEWLPDLPEFKWDETLLNAQPTIPAQESKPKSNVPVYIMDFTNGVPKSMSLDQKAFYRRLVDSIENKTYLCVDGQMDYLGCYVREKYKTFDKCNLQRLYEELVCLSVPYNKESAYWRPQQWSFDCLLALELYEKYFEVTKPVNIFSIRTHFANQKCNVRYFLGMPASGVDFLQIYGGIQNSITSFTKQHPAEFEIVLENVFEEDQQRNGMLFERILPRYGRQDYQMRLFECLYYMPSKIPCYNFYSVSDRVTEQICYLIREAENRLRGWLGEKRVGEQWDEETKLFYAIRDAFLDSDRRESSKRL